MKSLLLIMLALVAPPAHAADPSLLQNLCGKHGPPILSYQDLFADPADPARNEIWLDRSKDEIKGLWLNDKTALHIDGRMTAKDAFYLCLYDHKKDDLPKAVYFGRYLPNSIQIVDGNNKVVGFPRVEGFFPGRNYGVEYKVNKDVFQLSGKTSEDEPDTCVFSDAYFVLLDEGRSPGNKAINKKIQAVFQEQARLKERPRLCEKEPHFPLFETLAFSVMYAGPRFVSVKVDVVAAGKGRSDWNGQTLNFERSKGTELDFEDIISETAKPSLVRMLKSRLQIIQGETGRFKDLAGVLVSFTNQTLVFSFAPVDEQGWYLKTFRLDIPVPIYLGKEFLKKGFLP